MNTKNSDTKIRPIRVTFLKTVDTGQVSVGVIKADIINGELQVTATGKIAKNELTNFINENENSKADDVIRFLTMLQFKYDNAYMRVEIEYGKEYKN